MDFLGRSWLTTVIGLIGAIAQVLLPLLERGAVTPEELLQASLYAALGWAAKTFNVTSTDREAKESEDAKKVGP